MQHEQILILDFGSQYTQLIARRVRELGVYCEIAPFHISLDEIIKRNPRGIILSGGPNSVYETDAPKVSNEFFDRIDVPILGICYGMQLVAQHFGGDVRQSDKREYGFATIQINDGALFWRLKREQNVWMSHGDHVFDAPKDFQVTAKSGDLITAIENSKRQIYGLQFHPEVSHTPQGKEILSNFVKTICSCRGDWTSSSFIKDKIAEIRETVGENENVICGLSGGVDSTVAATLVHEAIGNRQTCIFVDNGLLRADEFETTLKLYEQLNLNVRGVNASQDFYDVLQNVTEPETKRKNIGRKFIEVFDSEAKKIGNAKFLVQGTLYPDVIESVSLRGASVTIKTHHNVGGLPEKMNLKLIEPLRELFKDEVRKIGKDLLIPDEVLMRHPFPGPGMAVRILGEVTPEKVIVLQAADRIFQQELKSANLYAQTWQAFCVLLPVETVGVMGDFRTYEKVLAIRAITSTDGMTADWARLPHEFLAKVSSRITSEVRGINRVVYDITSKPPATIEWE